jgi:cytoskeletal protein RodZ
MEDGVTVGEALAQARDAAGLSVEEVSVRTGIRETVIRDIEHDDFGALGGDLYVRGYLRAISGAIGLDAQPLIRRFDGARAAARAASTVVTPAAPPPTASPAPATPAIATPAPATLAPATLPSRTGTAKADEDYSSLWWADDAVSDADPPPVTRAAPASIPFGALAPPGPSADNAAPWPNATQPGQAARPARRPPRPPRTGPAPRSRVRGWRWVTTISVLTVAVLAIAGVATGEVVAKLRSPGHASAAPTATVRPAAENSPASSTPTATPAATSPAAVEPSPPKPPPAVRLAVRKVSAFGPDGVADGDNPQTAGNVINPGAPLPWQSDWYATAKFGMLKDGTGILLDMGKTVTITSVQVKLGNIRGADLQVRAGTTASLSAAPLVASAQDAGGQLTLGLLKPAQARYLIIWFTSLPPSGNGNYQATIYSVAITGQP